MASEKLSGILPALYLIRNHSKGSKASKNRHNLLKVLEAEPSVLGEDDAEIYNQKDNSV